MTKSPKKSMSNDNGNTFENKDTKEMSQYISVSQDSYDDEDYVPEDFGSYDDVSELDKTEPLESAKDMRTDANKGNSDTLNNGSSDAAEKGDDDFDGKKDKKQDASTGTSESSDDSHSKHNKKIRKAGSVGSDVSFICIMIAMIVIILGLLAVYISRNFPGETFGQKVSYIFTTTFTDDLITQKPTIEPSETADGEPAVIITVYAKKGCVVSFREGATSIERTVEGQSIAFRVPTALWTNSVKDEDMDSVVIKPNVFVHDPSRSNEVIQVEFEPYKAALQEVDITITSPSTDVFATTSTSVNIEGHVSDNSVAVFMNGKQLQIDEDGYFRTVYHITAEGEQKVVFTAQKSGYAIGSKVLKVNYSKSNVDIEIYNESMRTFEDTLEIRGKLKSNGKLEVHGVELEGDVKQSSSGDFSFTAKLPSVGNYTITLKTKDGEKESSMEIYAEHAPNADEYMRQTSDFDYDWLLDHTTMMKNFGITGTVTEVYQQEPYVRAKLHTSDGDLVFIYYHTTEVSNSDNKTYRIYGYPDGTDSETGLPQIYCWFIYKS